MAADAWPIFKTLKLQGDLKAGESIKLVTSERKETNYSWLKYLLNRKFVLSKKVCEKGTIQFLADPGKTRGSSTNSLVID